MGTELVDRRDVLRSGAVLGGGLLGSVFASGSVAADDSEGQTAATDDEEQTAVVGYMTRSSYRHLTESADVDCVPGETGWGGTFYVERVAEDASGETGVSVAVPDPSASSETTMRCKAYTITADEYVDLSGGPSGHGPWRQPCGSWAFVEDGTTLETAAVYRVSKVHDTEPTDATATDSDGEEIGLPMELLRVSFERAPPAAQWTHRRKLTNGCSATAVDGPTAVLRPADGGPATVMTLTDGGWTADTQLDTDSDIHTAPAVSGDTVVLGGPRDSTTVNRSVIVYSQADGGWETQATLRPDDLDRNAGFGAAFDIDGDTLVVGAPGSDGTDEDSDGTVYVYTRSDGTWTLEATLEDTRDVDDTASGLGVDVAVDGDTVVAGAPDTTYDDFSFDSVGAGFVFTRSDGDWSQEAFLRCNNPDDGDRQGDVVAVEDDTAVIASPKASKSTDWDDCAGTAWVFARDGSTWDQQARLTPDDWDMGDWFASSVSLDGETILVGSNTRDRDGERAHGVAYLFTRDGSTWDQGAKLTARDGESQAQFGSSVALGSEFAFVGARGDEAPDGSDGATYIFEH